MDLDFTIKNNKKPIKRRNMNKLKLKIGDVVEAKNGKTLLLETEGGVYERLLTPKKYDKAAQKWVDDEKSAQKVEDICKKYLQTTYDEVDSAVGLEIEVFEHKGKIYFEEFVPLEKVTDSLPKFFKCKLVDVLVQETAILPIVQYNGYNYKVGGYAYKIYNRDKEDGINFTKRPQAQQKFIDDIGYNCHYEQLESNLDEIKNMLIGKEITVVRQVTGPNQWLSTEWDFEI